MLREIIRGALAILKPSSLCIPTYFAMLHSFLMASIHTGAAYSNCASNAQLYIVFSASCLSPQLILADLDNAFINLVYLSVMYFMYISYTAVIVLPKVAVYFLIFYCRYLRLCTCICTSVSLVSLFKYL